MIIYRGSLRNTEVVRDVVDVGCGAGAITCIECGGDGDWGKFLGPEMMQEMHPGLARLDCVECKGTGRTFVAI